MYSYDSLEKKQKPNGISKMNKKIIKYKNNDFISLYIVVILSFSYLILYSKFINSENIVSIFALFLSFITILITTQFNLKSLNQTKENMIIQLEYKDKKNAINLLQNLINTVPVNHDLWINNLEEFRYSYMASLIPKEIIKTVFEKVDKVKNAIDEYNNKKNKEYFESLSKEKQKEILENSEKSENGKMEKLNFNIKREWYELIKYFEKIDKRSEY